jgi:hypothetical protein
MLSALVTCQTLHDALELRLVAEDYLDYKINIDSVIVTLGEMLIRLDPPYHLKDCQMPDYSYHYDLFATIRKFLIGRLDDTYAQRIFFESTDAIFQSIGGHFHAGRQIISKSTAYDKESGLPDQPIMKALALRSSVGRYITSRIEINVAVAELADELHWITGKWKCDIADLFNSLNLTGGITNSFNLLTLKDDTTENLEPDTAEDTKSDIVEDKPCDIPGGFVVTLSCKCSDIVNNRPELCLTGTHTRRIAIESMAAFLQYYQRNPEEAHQLIEESMSNDDHVKITEELNMTASGLNRESWFRY